MTTSVGRLFDAVAALLGGRRRVTYEGQAAIELEARARTVARRRRAHLRRHGRRSTAACSTRPRSWRPWSRDRDAGVDPAVLAAGFHEALGRRRRRAGRPGGAGERGIDTVVLTGGVFQNARLTEVVEGGAARRRPRRCCVHEQVPPNDGGISIGQAAVAAATAYLVDRGPIGSS